MGQRRQPQERHIHTNKSLPILRFDNSSYLPIYPHPTILSSYHHLSHIHDLIKLIVDAIDNNMTSIDPTTHAGNFENFKNKVAGVLMAIVHSGEAACGVTKSTRDFITIHSGYPYLLFSLSFFSYLYITSFLFSLFLLSLFCF